jgi:hypothetical protein
MLFICFLLLCIAYSHRTWFLAQQLWRSFTSNCYGLSSAAKRLIEHYAMETICATNKVLTSRSLLIMLCREAGQIQGSREEIQQENSSDALKSTFRPHHNRTLAVL